MLELNIHHKIIEKLLKYEEDKVLTHLIIATQDPSLIFKDKKEFIWQNQWYDLIELYEKEGMYYITAYADKKEGKIYEHLADALEVHQKNPHKQKNYQKFELKESYVYSVQFVFSRYSFYTIERPIPIDFPKSDIYLPVFSPPPEIFSIA